MPPASHRRLVLELEVQNPRQSTETPLAVVLGHEHSMLRLVRTVLEELGIEAYIDEPANGVVPTIARLQPTLVIIDVDFVHEAPTWAVLRALKEDAETREIPVIACAAAPWLLAQQKPLLDGGGVRTWTEPYDPLELLRTIDAATSERSADHEVSCKRERTAELRRSQSP